MTSVKKVLSYTSYVKYLVSVRGMMLAAILTICCPHLAAQTFSIGWNAPGTKVFIANATSDNSPVQLTWDGKLKGLVGERRSAQEFIPYGYFGSVAAEFRLCEATEEITSRNDPPTWATDISRLGGLALTHEYLESVTERSDLEHRVKDIKRFLKNRIDQGGKDQSHEIDAWLNSVKQDGLRPISTACTSPKLLTGVISVNQAFWYWAPTATVIITVRGSRETGYRLDGPDKFFRAYY